MASKTLRQAEKNALDGTNESQDTLVIAHYLMKDFGVGLRSSSPPPESPSLPSPKRSRSPSRRGSTQSFDPADGTADQLLARPGLSPITTNATPATAMHRTGQAQATRGTRHGDDAEVSQSASVPETQDIGSREDDQTSALVLPGPNVGDEDGAVGDLNLLDTLPPSHDLAAESDRAPGRKKMDATQSSTQPNSGRSYDQYRRPPSPGRTSPGVWEHDSPHLSRPSSPGRRAQADEDGDDTAAVRFSHPHRARTEKLASPGQDDSGLVDFGNLAHLRQVASQKTVPSPVPHFPETPAPPQNPFRHSRSQLLPTSQLFRGTQSSSPVKLASPTSSRPSPASFPAHSISPNPPISSPLKARGLRSSPAVDITSSPDILPGTASPKLSGRATSPVGTASTQNPVVPESSHDAPARKKRAPKPMSTYEPMRKSQERRSTAEPRFDIASSAEDDDDFDSITRRRKARSKKEAALKQLTAISFPRPGKSDDIDIEVPSTSQRRRASQAEAYSTACQRGAPEGNDPEWTGPDPVQEYQGPCPPATEYRPPVDDDATQSDLEGGDEPVAEPTPSIVPGLSGLSTRPTTNEPVSGPQIGPIPIEDGDAIPETSPAGRLAVPPPGAAPPTADALSNSKPMSNFQSSPPAFSTRSRSSRTRATYARAPGSTSSLSNLASTPELVSSEPPSGPPSSTVTATASSPTDPTVLASSSPAVAQTKRRGARGSLSRSKTGSTESLRQSRRVTRLDSDSTDELSKSVSAAPTFEQSLRVSRLSMSRSASRSGRAVMKPPPTQRDRKLFENMAFAISFQSRKPGESNDQYRVRMDFAATIQRRIKQAGGRVLENGFDELFEVPRIGTPTGTPASSPGGAGAAAAPSSSAAAAAILADISLTPESRATGFTALIADGHSRKVKYMQALALGLPCIAARWVTTCLDRGELVDWAPYLLCAGQSAFLADAIRSRSLAPYDAAAARLADVVARRARLLHGSRILAVVKRSVEARKMAYVFLARVLGASLTRVHVLDEARAEMRAAEAAGRPFDWVYVDGKADEEALFARPSAQGGGGSTSGSTTATAVAAATTVTTGNATVNTAGRKKRKRASAVAATAVSSAAAEPPPKRVRTLSDELVIQSLILGRLIEEGEMEG